MYLLYKKNRIPYIFWMIYIIFIPLIKNMKDKCLIILLLLVFQFGFSQSKKRISGKVVCGDYSVQGVEVVNLVSEETTITDVNGNFLILAKTDDMLVFVSKNYEYKRLSLDSELIEKNNFVISYMLGAWP